MGSARTITAALCLLMGCDAGGTALIGAELGAMDRPASDGSAGVTPDGSADGSGAATIDGPVDVACGPAQVVDPCAQIPALAAAPTLDGILDCGLALSAIMPVAWTLVGTGPDGGTVPPGNSASLAVAWRPDGLYVFIAVVDPLLAPADIASPAFFGDGVELYVDSDGVYSNPPHYDNPGTIQLVATAPADTLGSSHRGERYRDQGDEGAWSSTQWGAFRTTTGYAIEAFVTAADLGLSTWSLSPQQHIGFNVAVDVSYATAATTGPNDHRLGQYWLYYGPPPDLQPYQDVRSFCTPTLGSP